MGDFLSGLPPQSQGVAAVVFGIVVAFYAARNWMNGKREGAPKPVVQEFGFTGQLADMGPVKALIENTGLLIMQQSETSLALRRTAEGLERLAAAYEGEILGRIRDGEIEDEVTQRMRERDDEEERDRKNAQRRATAARRRRTAGKTPATK